MEIPNLIVIIGALVAAALHVVFFTMESILWTKPSVMRAFGQRPVDAAATRLLALNQGFYNLFLALITAAGAGLLITGDPVRAMTLIAAGCAAMLGAAVVLLASSPRLFRGALLQGVPPAIALVAMVFS